MIVHNCTCVFCLMKYCAYNVPKMNSGNRISVQELESACLPSSSPDKTRLSYFCFASRLGIIYFSNLHALIIKEK